jgi:hypothetical protein
MAPSCLGAIKGTPRRMEDDTKLSRNILRLLDPDSTHLILCVCDLSSIELQTPCVVFRAQVVTCVRGCAADLSLACVALPNLTLCFLCDLYCKGERLQIVEIPHNREKYSKGKDRGIRVDHWIT